MKVSLGRGVNVSVGGETVVAVAQPGLAVGYVFAPMLLPLVQPPLFLCVFFCQIMFLDWLVQRLELHPSTNPRRLLTGTLCGYGLMSGYIQVGRWCIDHVLHFARLSF